MLRRLLVTPTRLQRVAAAVLALAGVSALFYLGAQPGSGDFIPQGTDKVVHFLAFGGLAAVLSVADTGRHPIGIVLSTTAVGLADEIHQHFIPGRHSDAWDLGCDLLGAVAFVWIISKLRARLASASI